MFADATIQIGKAFRFDPRNLEVRVHYATVLEWIGKEKEALELWETILELTDDNRIRQMAREHFWEIRGRGIEPENPG
jgi:cytochrome c-type biogenesis protein CcmH/NrfG